MKRSLAPDPFNAIANHPNVRAGLGGSGELDLTTLVRDPANFCLLTPNEDGAYILQRLQIGLYSAHTLAMPSARGRPMLQLMREGFAWLFTATDAIEIVTTVPDGADKASRWADAAGFVEMFRRERCVDQLGVLVGGSFRRLAYADWVLQSPVCRAMGERFHALDAVPVDHEDDPVHDRWVGATVLGCMNGNVLKAVGLYNRWAVVAGYAQADVLSTTPPLVDIGSAVIGLAQGELEVLAARSAPH